MFELIVIVIGLIGVILVLTKAEDNRGVPRSQYEIDCEKAELEYKKREEEAWKIVDAYDREQNAKALKGIAEKLGADPYEILNAFQAEYARGTIEHNASTWNQPLLGEMTEQELIAWWGAQQSYKNRALT